MKKKMLIAWEIWCSASQMMEVILFFRKDTKQPS